MLTPSPNNPLPWSKRTNGLAMIWGIEGGNGVMVAYFADEQLVDFIVAAANATQAIVWEIDSREWQRDQERSTR
jgi:hypothetical protein